MRRALVAFALLVVGATVEAAPPAGGVRVTATALGPPRGGWTDVLVAARAGDVPWHGVLALAGQSAKVHLALSVPARGQRVVEVPFWFEANGRGPQMWVDEAPAGTVAVPSDSEDRVLVVDAGTRPRSTWRAYEPLDLVVLSPDAAAWLRPAAAAALDTWVRWGGAVAAARPGAAPEARPLGGGMTIVAPSLSEARATLARARRAGHLAADPALAALRRWERRLPPPGVADGSAERPGRTLAVLVAGYAGLLGGVSILAARVPGVRRLSVHLILLAIAAGTLATWGVARAGGPRALDIDAASLLIARPDGQATHISAVLRLRAHRSATTRWAALARTPMLYEVELRRSSPSPHRAVRWDVDRGVWERTWAVGEAAIVRTGGEWPDLGIRARLLPGGDTWRLENGGPHTLRGVHVLPTHGAPRPLHDLPPSAVTHVETRSTSDRDASAPSWAAPLLDGEAPEHPLLLATLDRPIAALDFVDGAVRFTGESHVVIPLPRRTTPEP